MNILITGGTGFIGKQLIQQLIQDGHSVTNLTTQENQERIVSEKLKHVYWNPSKKTISKNFDPKADAVINLAGFSVANKWNPTNKALMISSRIQSTEFLCEIIHAMEIKPTVFVGASASGFYKNSDQIQDETATKGTGFLSDLTFEWEQSSSELDKSIRKIHLRIGVVLSAKDGALKKLTPIFKAGIGSAVGNGKQYMSWVHETDLVQMFVHCATAPVASGAYNATAPAPVTNFEFSKTLANVLRRPFFLPTVPAFVLKILFGEMSQLVLVSQRLSSDKIRSTGFQFKFNQIQEALTNIYGKQEN